jgi:hypothetical protein
VGEAWKAVAGTRAGGGLEGECGREGKEEEETEGKTVVVIIRRQCRG